MALDQANHYAAIRREFFERRAQRYSWLVSLGSAALATGLMFSVGDWIFAELGQYAELALPFLAIGVTLCIAPLAIAADRWAERDDPNIGPYPPHMLRLDPAAGGERGQKKTEPAKAR